MESQLQRGFVERSAQPALAYLQDQAWLERLPPECRRLSPLGDLDAPLSGLRGEWAER